MITPAKSKAFEVDENGIMLTSGGVEIGWICGGDVDPSAGSGIPAPLGASYYRTNGDLWRKTTASDTGWQLSGLGDPVVIQTMSFGSGGNLPTSTWISRTGSVASNIVGVVVTSTQAKIKSISVANENSTSFTIGVYSHDGNEANLALLTSVVVSGAVQSAVNGLDISVAQGKEIAMRVTAGSVKNFGGLVTVKGVSL